MSLANISTILALTVATSYAAGCKLQGGLCNNMFPCCEGFTCTDDNSSGANGTFLCSTLNIPDCEDRTVYCAFPPDYISGGNVIVNPNPSPNYKKNDECRWTKWFNLGKGSKGDSESIEELYSVFQRGSYGWNIEGAAPSRPKFLGVLTPPSAPLRSQLLGVLQHPQLPP